MRKVWLVGVVWLLLAGTAAASTVVSAESGTRWPYQRWANQAKVPTPDTTLTVYDGASEDSVPYCGQLVLGCASADGGWVFIGASYRYSARMTFLHELGHLYGSTWDEHYADSYAFCARHGLKPDAGYPHRYRALCRRLLSLESSGTTVAE